MTAALRRLGNGVSAVGGVLSAEVEKAEEPLCIGLGVADEPRRRRQSGAREHDGQVFLTDSMLRGDERGKLFRAQALDVVHQQQPAFASLAASPTATKS